MPGRVVEVGREGERGVRLAGVRSGRGGGFGKGWREEAGGSSPLHL